MRITQTYMANTVQHYINLNKERLINLQEMIATQKKINRPSDDPIGAGNVLGLRTVLDSIDQYVRNISFGRSFLQTADTALGSTYDELAKAKELALTAANGTITPENRLAMVEEVEGIFYEVIQQSNARYDDRYVFSGFQSKTTPFTETGDWPDKAVEFNGDAGELEIEIGREVRAKINLDGENVFKAAGEDVFEILVDLRNAMNDDDVEGIQDQLDRLDSAMNRVLSNRADVGARIRRLDSAESNHMDFTINLTERLSMIEDTDLAETISDLANQEAILQATLSTASIVIQTSLLNFLR